MKIALCLWTIKTILVSTALLSEAAIIQNEDFDIKQASSDGNLQLIPFQMVADAEYIRHVHSMFNAYRGADNGGSGGVVIETNELIDTKYRTWKRNADFINSLLALPKTMNDAGR